MTSCYTLHEMTDPKRKITIYLPGDLAAFVAAEARRRRRETGDSTSVSEIVQDALRDWMKKTADRSMDDPLCT